MRFNCKSRAWPAVILAVLAALAPCASADDSDEPDATTKPATRAAAVLQADTLLASFPRNASVIASRSDAKALTLEGRVRDVRMVPLPATRGGDAGSEVHVILVGKSQADDAPAHFTCRFDKATADDAARLKPDMLVRLTGAVGALATNADRVELNNCHDLAPAGELTLAQQLMGHWSFHPEGIDTPARGRGPVVARVEIAFAADGTFNEEAFDESKSLRKVSGRWTVKGDAPDQKLRLEPRGSTFSENPAHLEDRQLTFTPAGLTDLHVAKEVTASKVVGTEMVYDGRAMKDQTLRWFSNNIALQNQQGQTLLKTASNFIDQSQPGGTPNSWYAFDAGSGLTTNKHTTQVLVCNGKMFVLPYSDAQTQRTNVNPRDIRVSELRSNAVLMVPEAKIDALTLDGKSLLATTKPLTGKITCRLLGRAADADYVLLMTSVHGTFEAPLPRTPGADAETMEFSIDLGRGGMALAEPDPLGVVFTLGRQNKPGSGGADQKLRAISEPMAQLMDIAK